MIDMVLFAFAFLGLIIAGLLLFIYLVFRGNP